MDEATKAYFESGQFNEAITALEKAINNGFNQNAADYHLLSRSYLAVGEIRKASKYVEEALAIHPENTQYRELRNTCHNQLHQVDIAVDQITDGQHSTSEIHFAKGNVHQLIEHDRYEIALERLHKMAEARKAKTTNILWIGHYLKDIYFDPKAEELKVRYDKLMLDEVLFYYLKACKLFEEGYRIIREEVKKKQAEKKEEN